MREATHHIYLFIEYMEITDKDILIVSRIFVTENLHMVSSPKTNATPKVELH